MHPLPTKPASTVAKLTAIAAVLLLLQACAAPQPAPAPALAPEPPSTPTSTPAPPAVQTALNGRMTADAHEYPWSALGRVNLAGRGFCTGIVIGPRPVLTQARCLYDGRDGRWFRPQELHFIAAYQQDSYLADSPVSNFSVAPGFNPAGGISLNNLTNNWALLKLQKPIGGQTGWLSINWDDTHLGPDSVVLHAGFRRDRPHAINLHFGCAPAVGAVDLCAPTPAEQSLPVFVLVDGQLEVVGEYYTRWASQGPNLLESAQLQDGAPLASARPPSRDSLVGRQPTATISRLLDVLGYPVTGGDIASAAASFRRDSGLPGGGTDIVLLTELLSAVQKQAR